MILVTSKPCSSFAAVRKGCLRSRDVPYRQRRLHTSCHGGMHAPAISFMRFSRRRNIVRGHKPGISLSVCAPSSLSSTRMEQVTRVKAAAIDVRQELPVYLRASSVTQQVVPSKEHSRHGSNQRDEKRVHKMHGNSFIVITTMITTTILITITASFAISDRTHDRDLRCRLSSQLRPRIRSL